MEEVRVVVEQCLGQCGSSDMVGPGWPVAGCCKEEEISLERWVETDVFLMVRGPQQFWGRERLQTEFHRPAMTTSLYGSPGPRLG